MIQITLIHTLIHWTNNSLIPNSVITDISENPKNTMQIASANSLYNKNILLSTDSHIFILIFILVM